jgi:hypothetical protein
MILRPPGCASSAEGKPWGTVVRPLSMGGKHMADGRSEPSKPPDGSNEQPTRADWFPWGSGGSRSAGVGSRRVLLITAAVCLCVVAAGVSVAVFSSPGGSRGGHMAGVSSNPTAAVTQAAQPTASTAPSPAASSRATSRSDVTSHGVATSALRWPPHLKRQILSWKAGPGGKALATVNDQMGSAMQAAGLKLYASMRLTCTELASDIGTAQAEPPIPYAAMQRMYAKALARLSTAAADCRSAISLHAQGDENTSVHVNQALLSQSRLEFAATSKVLYRATAQIQSA